MGEFLGEHLGDVASVLGFLLTICLLLATCRSAKAARTAAENAADQLRRSLSLSDLTTAAGIVEQIMQLQRTGKWDLALDRYCMLGRLVVRVRAENPSLTKEQRRELQAVLNAVSRLRHSVELLQSGERERPDVVEWNRVLNMQLVKLEPIAASVKLSQGEQP